MHLLLNIDLEMIVGRFEDSATAGKALDEANFDGHVVNADTFAGIHTLRELSAYYNNLPYGGAHPVERFTNRPTAIRSINEAIVKGGVTEMATKKRSRKAASKKKAANGAPRGRARSWTKVEITAAGKADDVRFVQDNPRFKVYEYIKKHGEVTAETLIKFGEGINLTRAQLMGCIGKLVFRKLVRLV